MNSLSKFIAFSLTASVSVALRAAELQPAHQELSVVDRVSRNQEAAVKELLLQDEADVQRDQSGRITNLRLIGRNAADKAIRLACALDTLQSLAIQGPSPSNSFTTNSIRSLSALTNLSSLELVCMGRLEPGVFEGICHLGQLRTLTFGFAFPERSEYASITNLTKLVRLNLSYCTNFGDAEVHFLTNLVSLRSLELNLNGFSPSETNLLAELPYLTNKVVVIREP